MSSHPVSLKLYFAVFLGLLALTFGTVWVAGIDLGPFNTLVALAIAAVKASLVLLYFMHLRWSSNLARTFAGAGLLFLVILITFTLSDFLTRDWLVIYGPG